MSAQNNYKVHLLLLGVVVSNALNYSISKHAMHGGISPMTIIIIRIVCTSLFFWGLSLFMKINEPIEKKDIGRLLLCSLLGISSNQILFYNGLNLSTPINVAVMSLMTPIIIFLITHFILKEKSRWWQFVGFAMACVGAYLLVSIKGADFNENTFTGDMLVLCNSTVYALFMVLVTPLMRKYHPVTVMKYVFSLAIPVALPFTYADFMNTPWFNLSTLVWWSLAFIVGFGTIYNYYVNTWSLKHVSPAVNGGYIYLIPLLTAIVAVLMSQDTLTTAKVIYGILIIVGVYLVNKKINNKSA